MPPVEDSHVRYSYASKTIVSVSTRGRRRRRGRSRRRRRKRRRIRIRERIVREKRKRRKEERGRGELVQKPPVTTFFFRWGKLVRLPPAAPGQTHTSPQQQVTL